MERDRTSGCKGYCVLVMGAYFATGAYVCAYLMKTSVPLILALPAAVVVALVVATLGLF